MTVRILTGDCREHMAAMEPNSVDAIVTDPPAGIAFMGKSWDSDKGGRDAWVSWMTDVMREALRVAKPGAHAFVWALPRTSGWTHRALEDAGWQIRDCCVHLFGSGFPKSLDVSKAIDKAAGAEREVIGRRDRYRDGVERQNLGDCPNLYQSGMSANGVSSITAPATDLARQWDGWGTALKPAAEFWYLARKPLSGTVAANVERYGTGAINVAACRIGTDGEEVPYFSTSGGRKFTLTDAPQSVRQAGTTTQGRWPANVILGCACDGETHDADCAVAMLDAQSGERASHDTTPGGQFIERNAQSLYELGHKMTKRPTGRGDTGGASRFFSTAKSSRRERNKGLDGMPATKRADDGYGSIQTPILDRAAPRENWEPHVTANSHPCVKPLDLMQWLVRLVTPPGGTVLDPFMGSGSTMVAADREGFNGIGIELDPEYVEIARRRVFGDAPLFAEVIV